MSSGFFNIGTGELMLIIIIAILVIGPKRMLELGQALGRLTRRGREIWSEVMKTIQAELQDTKEAVDEIAASGSDLVSEVKTTGQETEKALQKSRTETFDMQAELKELGRETQQVMKEVTEGFASIITGEAEVGQVRPREATTTEQSQDAALQKNAAAIPNAQTQTGEAGESQQVVKEATEGFASIITDQTEAEESQDEKADDKASTE